MRDKNSKSPIFQSSVPEKAVLWRKVESLPVQGVLFEKSSNVRTGSDNEPRRDHQAKRLLSLYTTPLPLDEDRFEKNN